MIEKTYTRQGIVTNERAPFRQYNFPIKESTNDNICIRIPYNAAKEDILEAVEHLQIIANRWTEN